MENFSSYHNQLVELFYDDEFDKLDVGLLLSEDDDHILLKFIDHRGREDGYNLINKRTVNIVKINTPYLKRIALLQEVQKSNSYNHPIFQHENIEIPNSPLLHHMLQLIKDKNWICKMVLWIDKDSVFGFIQNIYDDYVDIEYLGSKISVKLEDITHIYMNATSQKIDYLIDKQLGIIT